MGDFFRKSAAPYLSGILVTYVVALFAQYVWPTKAIIFSQNLSFILIISGLAVSVVLWCLYIPKDGWAPEFWWIFGAWIFLWVASIALSVMNKDLFNLTAILTPLPILLLALKKPSLSSTFTAGDVFVYFLIGIAVLSHLLDVTGAKTLEFEGWNRWPFVADFAGPIGRWKGPFGNVNYAGPVGAFILTFGLIRFGWKRLSFIVLGAGMVFLSDSRSAMFICFIGVSAFIAVSPEIQQRLRSKWLRMVPLATVLVAAVAYVSLVDPTLNGRTPVWNVFIDLWRTSPVVGVGERGIGGAVELGRLEAWANHGHNIILDPMARSGLTGALAVLGLIFITTVVIVKSLRTGFSAPIILFSAFLAGGVSDNLVDWRYLGIHAVPLLLASILAATWFSERRPSMPKAAALHGE